MIPRRTHLEGQPCKYYSGVRDCFRYIYFFMFSVLLWFYIFGINCIQIVFLVFDNGSCCFAILLNVFFLNWMTFIKVSDRLKV